MGRNWGCISITSIELRRRRRRRQQRGKRESLGGQSAVSNNNICKHKGRLNIFARAPPSSNLSVGFICSAWLLFTSQQNQEKEFDKSGAGMSLVNRKMLIVLMVVQTSIHAPQLLWFTQANLKESQMYIETLKCQHALKSFSFIAIRNF